MVERDILDRVATHDRVFGQEVRRIVNDVYTESDSPTDRLLRNIFGAPRGHDWQAQLTYFLTFGRVSYPIESRIVRTLIDRFGDAEAIVALHQSGDVSVLRRRLGPQKYNALRKLFSSWDHPVLQRSNGTLPAAAWEVARAVVAADSALWTPANIQRLRGAITVLRPKLETVPEPTRQIVLEQLGETLANELMSIVREKLLAAEVVGRVARWVAGVTTGLEEALAMLAEAAQGPGVVVLEQDVVAQRAGLEELIQRLPPGLAERVVVFRDGDVAGLAATLMASPYADQVTYVGLEEHAAALRQLLPGSMTITRLEPTVGLAQIILALGVPRKVIEQVLPAGLEESLALGRAA